MVTLRIVPYIYLKDTMSKGRGVFTLQDIPAGTNIEISSVLVLTEDERSYVEKTVLYDYIFEWGDEGLQCCVAWGYVSMYNHSYDSNCEYEMDFEQRVITIRTIKKIKAGEELTVNYNGDFDPDNPVWFDVDDD